MVPGANLRARNISWRPGLLAPPPALPGQATWFVGGSPAMASVRAAF